MVSFIINTPGAYASDVFEIASQAASTLQSMLQKILANTAVLRGTNKFLLKITVANAYAGHGSLHVEFFPEDVGNQRGPKVVRFSKSLEGGIVFNVIGEEAASPENLVRIICGPEFLRQPVIR